MIKSIDELNEKPLEIDLTASQGNAFFLLGTARNLAKQIGLDADEICKEMKSSDYEHLVEVFDREFGDYVILYR